jgi:hypothetical protein
MKLIAYRETQKKKSEELLRQTDKKLIAGRLLLDKHFPLTSRNTLEAHMRLQNYENERNNSSRFGIVEALRERTI